VDDGVIQPILSLFDDNQNSSTLNELANDKWRLRPWSSKEAERTSYLKILAKTSALALLSVGEKNDVRTFVDTFCVLSKGL
jgi:hypothetical protein